MLEHLSILIIRFFFNPFIPKLRTEYRYLMNGAKNIIFSCPAEEKNKKFGISLKKFTDLFPKKSVTILYPELTLEKCKTIPNYIDGYPPKIKYNLLHLIHSDNLSQLGNKKCDIFIDLDPHVNLLNLLLCRQLNPALRISFDKRESKHFYNIRYNYNSQKSYAENRTGLYTFLNSMINKKSK